MPVPRQTSQARAMRWLSAASAGRRWRDRRGPGWRAAPAAPWSASRRRASARASGPGSGMSARPSVRAREIQAGAAGQDRQAACGAGLLHRGQAFAAPPGDAAGFGGGTDAVEGGGDAGFFVRRGAGGEDAEFAIHLHGVGVDDRAVAAFGDGQRQRGFAAGGRTGDDQRVGRRIRRDWHHPFSLAPGGRGGGCNLS